MPMAATPSGELLPHFCIIVIGYWGYGNQKPIMIMEIGRGE
jgi:hypothetical protein